jgi:putative ABC transport system permease protein
MRTSDLIQETYGALSANKVRSGLTMLGVVIGISSVIAMVSIGQGAAGSIQASIEGLGSNLLTVTPGSSQGQRGQVSGGRGSSRTLVPVDAEALRGIEGVAYVSAEFNSRNQLAAQNGNNTNASVVGVTPDYLPVRNVTMASGSFIGETHLRSLGRVIVLGATLATDLFAEDDPVGKTVRVDGGNYKVIGVLTAKGGTSFNSPDTTAYVPLTTMQKILTGSDYLTTAAISVQDKERMSQVKAEATSLLAARHKVDPAEADFSIISQEDVIGTLTQVTSTFTTLLAAIAGISLVVGGIGIMNMMLTTVTERMREIGLRKAIGAKRKDIGTQFLAESVLLTFVGGGIGILLGWAVSLLITRFSGMATEVSAGSVALAFGVSALIGIIFGWYPARRASGMNPIEALRYE